MHKKVVAAVVVFGPVGVFAGEGVTQETHLGLTVIGFLLFVTAAASIAFRLWQIWSGKTTRRDQ